MATNTSVNSPLSGTTGTGNFVGSTSPTLTTPKIDQINDTNNNQIIGFLPIANAVNTIQIANAYAGGQCNINTAGSDANINLAIAPKGTGFLRYYTQATSNQLTVNTGTNSVHETLFQFPNTSASRSVTFPDLSGTVALSGAGMNVDFGIMQCNSIYAPNGTGLINPNGVTNAVNFWTISNNSTGQPVYMASAGSDANVGQYFITKGDAGVVLQTAATSATPLAIQSGTSSQHTTNFSFSNTAAARTVTFPDASGTIQLQQASPTIQKFTSGSGTYTTPAGVKYIVVQMAGAGGGGGGSSDNAGGGTGGTGGTTSFGSSLLTCTGGAGGTGGNPANGGAGGSATLNSPAYGVSFAGQSGAGAAARGAFGINEISGLGGSTFFGGGGNYVTSSSTPVVGNTATSNTGSGGGGAANGNGVVAAFNGGGGGSGGYLTAFIASPSATYSYSIGVSGAAGAAGSNGADGGVGAAGIIIITEYYQ